MDESFNLMTETLSSYGMKDMMDVFEADVGVRNTVYSKIDRVFSGFRSMSVVNCGIRGCRPSPMPDFLSELESFEATVRRGQEKIKESEVKFVDEENKSVIVSSVNKEKVNEDKFDNTSLDGDYVKNPVSQFNEMSQVVTGLFLKEEFDSAGFKFRASLNGEILAECSAFTKKQAKFQTAKKALDVLKNIEKSNKGKKNKVLCDICGFDVDPEGHENRCVKKEILIPTVGDKYDKYLGDVYHKMLLVGIIRKQKIIENTGRSVEEIVSQFINRSAQSQYWKEFNGIKLSSMSDHKYADLFEIALVRDVEFVKKYLVFVESELKSIICDTGQLNDID